MNQFKMVWILLAFVFVSSSHAGNSGCDSLKLRTFLSHLQKNNSQDFQSLRTQLATRVANSKAPDQIVFQKGSHEILDKVVFRGLESLQIQVANHSEKLWLVFEEFKKSGTFTANDASLAIFKEHFYDLNISRTRFESAQKILANLSAALENWHKQTGLSLAQVSRDYFVSSLSRIVFGNFGLDSTSLTYKQYLFVLARYYDFIRLGSRTFAYPEEFFDLLVNSSETLKVVKQNFALTNQKTDKRNWYFLTEALFENPSDSSQMAKSDLFQIYNWTSGVDGLENLMFLGKTDFELYGLSRKEIVTESLYDELFFSKYIRFLFKSGVGSTTLEDRNRNAWVAYLIVRESAALKGLYTVIKRPTLSNVAAVDKSLQLSYEKYLAECAKWIHSHLQVVDRDLLFSSGVEKSAEYDLILNSLKQVLGPRLRAFKEISSDS
jgi:hypothetical protein